MDRFWRVVRPREGWGTFLLTACAVMCVPAAAIAAEWVPKDEGLVPLAFVALLVGRWLAARRYDSPLAWLPVAASLGLILTLSVASHTVVFVVPDSLERIDAFLSRLGAWGYAALTGGTSEDTDVFLFLAALACWISVVWFGRLLHRRQRPLLALVPLIIPTAASVFYSESGFAWLVGLLVSGSLMAVMGDLSISQGTWEKQGVDYATDLEANALVAALAASLTIGVVSYFGPQLTFEDLSDQLDRALGRSSPEVEDAAERLFGGVSPARRGSSGDEGASGYLPRSRLLGGSPELLDAVVMRVWTDEPPPLPEYVNPERALTAMPPHYWQGVSFDSYSGRGWAVTVGDREPAEGELDVLRPPLHREVTQRYEFVAPHGDTLYTLSVPTIVTGSVDVIWRGGGEATDEVDAAADSSRRERDLAGLASEVTSYTIVSLVPQPTASGLRSAPAQYTEDLVELYLDLPDSVPRRVRDLAAEVTAPGETVYEQARLLEQYLRQYPYSLEVERPPAGRDVADFFLFDAKEGYCDYYATAYVVMARAVGIPARLVSGYVGGEYDDLSGAYQVRHYNSHSWPEVFFPEWGWVGFEPTGAQPVRELPEDIRLPSDVMARPSGPPGRVVRSRWRVGALAGLGVAAFAILVVWLVRRRRNLPPPLTVPDVWVQMGEAGRRMGLEPDPALTPREYAACLAGEMVERASRARRLQQDWVRLAEDGGAAVHSLADMYILRAYGHRRAREWDEAVARRLWSRLQRPLRWLTWLGRLQRRTLPRS
jgi:transglutaminase-like putative cysteine protease